jgi:hypothetical protein
MSDRATANFNQVLSSALLAACLAGGCARGYGETPPRTPTPPAAKEPLTMDADLQSMVRAALVDAAQRAAPGSATPTVLRAERVTWPDGSLGCPQPGRMYTMALVPGYRVRIQAGAEQLDYHASLLGQPALCPPGRATEPVPVSRIR